MTLDQTFDRLFASLPVIHPIRRNVGSLAKSYPHGLQYPLNRPYLGFTPVDRRREHQVQVWLTRSGIFPRAGACSVCDNPSGNAYHAENYFDVWAMPSICRGCHKTLHMRHRNPAGWRALVDRYSRTREEWFALTPVNSDADFSGYLRRRFGDGYDLLRVSIYQLPGWVSDQLPESGLLPVDFGEDLQPVAKPNVRPRPARQLSLDLPGGVIRRTVR